MFFDPTEGNFYADFVDAETLIQNLQLDLLR